MKVQYKCPNITTFSQRPHSLLPVLCLFCEVDANEDFRGFPELDDVDDVLRKQFRKQRIAITCGEVRLVMMGEVVKSDGGLNPFDR
jgi:hypothetical protein